MYGGWACPIRRDSDLEKPVVEKMRNTTAILVFVLYLAVPGQVMAQPSSPVADEASASAADLERLQKYRGFIENKDDSMATRTAQAEELLLTGWSEAVSMVILLLGPEGSADTKIVLCHAVELVARKGKQPLDDHLIEPMLQLLAHESSEVTAASASALSALPDASGEVAQAIAAVAADSEKPMRQRLAAVEALAPNTDRIDVVGALVGLLEAKEKRLTDRVVQILSLIADVDLGDDKAKWHQWWKDQDARGNESRWLHDQIRHHRRQRELAIKRLADEQASANRRCRQLAERLAQSLSDHYRLSPPAQKDSLLAAWLAEPVTECRRVAVMLVAEQISEGKPPSDVLRSALRQRYTDASLEVRKLAIETVGALNDPAEAGAILASLGDETNQSIREATLRVLGKLRNPDAIPTLVTELNREGASDECVLAAADALGMLAARGRVDADVVATLVEPLKSKFAALADDHHAARAAILGAMAAIGAAEFKVEFESNLAADDPDLLVCALQGLAVVGNGEQMDRLISLSSHADARVRQRAIAAVGALGSGEHIPSIVTRLNPAVETVEGPRKAAWDAFKRICSRLSLGEKVAAVDRLADYPNLTLEYLKELHDHLSQVNPPPSEIVAVRQKLATIYGALGRNSEALVHWRQLFAGGNGHKTVYALDFLNCAIVCGKGEQIAEPLESLKAADDETRNQASAAIIRFIGQLLDEGKKAEAESLGKKIREVSGDSFPALVSFIEEKFATPSPAPTPISAPGAEGGDTPAPTASEPNPSSTSTGATPSPEVTPNPGSDSSSP